MQRYLLMCLHIYMKICVFMNTCLGLYVRKYVSVYMCLLMFVWFRMYYVDDTCMRMHI